MNPLEGPLPPPAKRIKGASYCKEGAIAIWNGKKWHCEHNHPRNLCKDCGGTAICEHNRRRSRCKDCGGASICEHHRQRSTCKDCGGTSICEHNRRRSQCKDCGGTSICEHNRRRSQCKDCGGTSICEHNRKRSHCKDCGGTSICEHNRQHSHCKECGGASICKHDRRCDACSDCGTGLCPKCGLWQTGGKICATCDPESKKRKRYDESRIEMKMIQFLQERVSWTILSMEQDFGRSCGYTNKRFDCVFPSRTGRIIIVIECDENGHATYPEKCEWTRPFAAGEIFQRKSVLFVRWNPDAWKVNGITIRVLKEEKMEVLWKTIQPYAEESCKHSQRRSTCKDCGGGSICKHNRQRRQCKDCGGSSICEHNRHRPQCKDCGGISICEHNRERSQCKNCRGASICKHDRIRSKCKDCGGASICEHNHDRFQCSDCGTALCPGCGLYQTKGKLCATCDPSSKTKKRYDESRIEMKMIRFLQQRVTWTLLSMEQNFGSSCGYTKKRFDCVFLSRTGIFTVVIECDENAHATYPENCEWTRPFAACEIFQEKPVLFVRWNPDAWKVNGTTIRISKEEKMEVLWKTIQPYAEESSLSLSSSSSSSYHNFGPLKVVHLYYPSTTRNPVHEFTQEELQEKMDVMFS